MNGNISVPLNRKVLSSLQVLLAELRLKLILFQWQVFNPGLSTVSIYL